MKDFCFEYEQTPWEATLAGLRWGDSISAARFLTLLEGEEETLLEDAFQDLEDRHIQLTADSLPEDFGAGDVEARLRREKQLTDCGKVLENLDPEDPLRIYLEELAGTPVAGDPQILALDMLDGKQNAQQRLLDATIGSAVTAAMQMTGHGVMLLDLIQEASLGLWQGILCYRGGDFESHSRWWIQQYLARTVTLQARQNGMGRMMQRYMQMFREADKRLLSQLGRSPTLEEIALELDISPEAAQVYQDMLQNAIAMEKVKQPPKEETEEDVQAVEDTAYFQSRQRIMEMLSILTAQEAQVLTLRFGLEGGQPYTHQQVGAKMNLTADQVVALEAEALSKLRKEQ